MKGAGKFFFIIGLVMIAIAWLAQGASAMFCAIMAYLGVAFIILGFLFRE